MNKIESIHFNYMKNIFMKYQILNINEIKAKLHAKQLDLKHQGYTKNDLTIFNPAAYLGIINELIQKEIIFKVSDDEYGIYGHANQFVAFSRIVENAYQKADAIKYNELNNAEKSQLNRALSQLKQLKLKLDNDIQTYHITTGD